MQTQVVRMDSAKLKQITNASHTSIVTMLLLALRERARGFSNITATKEQLVRMGEKVVEEDFQKFWKDMQDAGIGTIVYGRRGGPDRFQWHYSLKSVARVAIEGKENEVKELAKRKPKRVRIQKAAPKKQAAKTSKGLEIARKLYAIPLDGGVIAEVILPANATQSDLDKIKAALTR